MVKGTGLKKRRPLFRLIPCTFPSPSSAPSCLHPQLPSCFRPQLPSRLSASILNRLPVFVLCCLFRLVLCAFPSSSSAPSRLRPLLPSRLHSQLPSCFRPLRLPVFILSAFPPLSSAPSTSLTLPSPYPPTSPRYRLVPSHLASIILPTIPLLARKLPD